MAVLAQHQAGAVRPGQLAQGMANNGRQAGEIAHTGDPFDDLGQTAQPGRVPLGLRLRRFAVPDVLDDADEMAGRAVQVAHQGDRHLGPDGLAVVAQVTLVQGIGGVPAGQQAARLVQVGLHVLGVGDVLEPSLQKLFLIVADEFAQPAVDPQETAVGRRQGDTHRRLFEDGLEARLAPAQIVPGGGQQPTPVGLPLSRAVQELAQQARQRAVDE